MRLARPPYLRFFPWLFLLAGLGAFCLAWLYALAVVSALPGLGMSAGARAWRIIALTGGVGGVLLALALWRLLEARAQALRDAVRVNRVLLESEERLNAAQAIARLGSWDWDLVGNRLSCSAELRRLFELPPDTAEITPEVFLARMHADDLGRVRQVIENSLHRHVPYEIGYRIPLADGSEREILAQGEVELDTEGRPVRMHGTAQDVTERRMVQRALEAGTRYQRTLLDNLPAAVIVYGPDAIVRYRNAEALRLLGLMHEKAAGEEHPPLLREDGSLLPQEEYPVNQALARKAPLQGFIVGIGRGASTGETWVVANAYPDLDDAGRVRQVVVSFVDVTDRKRAESTLLKTQAMLQHVADVSPAATYVVTLDPQGTVPSGMRFQGRDIERMLGYPLAHWEVPGFWESNIHPEDRQRVLAAQRMLEEKGRLEHEYRLLHEDGSVVWINDRLVLVRDGQGCAREIVGTWLDVTERVGNERKLLRMNRFYAVLSQTNEAIVHLRDEARLFEEVCRIAVEVGGFRMAWIGMLDEAVGDVRPIVWRGHDEGYLDYVARTGVFRHDGPTARAIVQGVCQVNDDTARNKAFEPWRAEALERGYHSSAAFPLRRGGKAVGALTLYAGEPFSFTAEVNALFGDLADDVSFALDFIDQENARHAAKAHLSRLNEELERRVEERTRWLEAVNRELESFSYSVSHDLRAPLRGIDGFSRLLEQNYAEVLDATGKDYLLRVRRASQRMGELIDDLLALSRVSRVALRKETVDLGRMAREVLEELRARAPQRQVAIVVREDMEAEADGRLLQSVLENLLGNAWKFTARVEHARIEFGCQETEDGRAYFVRDNGAGFDMRYADRLFGAFQRLHRAEEFEGTGIGLATVQRIIARHGGRVWAEGEVGKGATFYFSLRGNDGQ